MSRHTGRASFPVMISCAYAALTACGGGGGGGSGSGPSGVIQHIVVIVQENRTPDNLFHGLAGADIADAGINSKGETIILQPTPLANSYDLSHTHQAFEQMYDNGKMDGADKVSVTCTSNCPPNPQFLYVQPSDVQPYFQLAQSYTFGDRMFESNQGPSFPAHQYIISGTSIPSVGGTYGDYYVAENPTPLDPTGCTAPSDERVFLIDPAGLESVSIYPCFEHSTLMDLLDQAGISWRYYAPTPGSIWTGPNAIAHLRNGADWSNVVIPETQVLSDIAANKLAQVVWVIPDGSASDHAGSNNGTGPSWVASIVNAIGSSSYWNNTAIIITWDDWGGWYDHVAPSIYNVYEYGFRVPLIVVSPYAKQGYVSHVVHDFGSILRFIEETFGLATLGYADARADNLADCFDFTQSPTSYTPVATSHDAAYFIHRAQTVPPTDPDDD
jgi:phospholipase C